MTSNCLFLRANIFFSSSCEVLNYIYIYIPYDSVSPKAHCIKYCNMSIFLHFRVLYCNDYYYYNYFVLWYGALFMYYTNHIEFLRIFPRASHFFIVQYFDARRMLLYHCYLQMFQEYAALRLSVCHLCKYTPLANCWHISS